MPGLCGFTDKKKVHGVHILSKMRSFLRYLDTYLDDELFTDGWVYASGTHLGIISQGIQPYCHENRFYCWMEGEFYNQDDLISKYNVTGTTDNALFAKLYYSTGSFDFLKDIDGYYVAVLYDKQEDVIYLITDRYRLRPLYWKKISADLVWSSELKAFLGHSDFMPKIDPQSVTDFLGVGYLLEDRSWFDGVEVVPPASVLTYDILKSQITISNYWSLSDISLLEEPIDQRAIVDELGSLFKQSVQRRIKNNEKIGITLSGGLDSRAILAAIPNDDKMLHTFTFGQTGCDDVNIATKVAKIKGTTHHTFDLNSNNWLMPRINGLWKSDGTVDLLSMHGVEFLDDMREYVDINLHGLLGDAILGGSYISLEQSSQYRFRNRGIRFINQGSIIGETLLAQRKPFFDKNLADFIFSIPEHLRKNSYIYNQMLLVTFPNYYYDIPWQKTGIPIGYSTRFRKLKNRSENKLKKMCQSFGLISRRIKACADIAAWIRQDPARAFFNNLLLSKHALYPEYMDRNKVRIDLDNHMHCKANYAYELCLALSFEIWLQQVFEAKYREENAVELTYRSGFF